MGLKAKKCKRGHSMRGKNLYILAGGQRNCKKCTLLRVRKQRRRLKRERREAMSKHIDPAENSTLSTN